MKHNRILVTVLVLAALLCGICLPASAAYDDALDTAAAFLYRAVPDPQPGSIGGEWAVVALARSGYAVPDSWYNGYYSALEKNVTDCKGVLSARAYTEYSRTIVGLAALGKDARNVAGYDLTMPLGDYNATIRQGNNGPVWALIALDSMDYPMPVCEGAAVQATRQMYVDRLLSTQRENGAWGVGSTAGDVSIDMTAMTLLALSGYMTNENVAAAADRALQWLSEKQDATGGFDSFGTSNSESVSQTIIALCALGIGLDDARFVKNGCSLMDNLMTYALPSGGFRHTADGDLDQMATEQAACALAAVAQAEKGNSLYRRGAVPVFYDIAGHPDRAAIEALVGKRIINGMGDGSFQPDKTMTRAEFATIVVKALGLEGEVTDEFSDVKSGDWFEPFVGAAYHAGIVNGMGDGTFCPEKTISRQEAATMVARAARRCGMDVDSADTAVLAQYTDGSSVADWAKTTMAFCLSTGLFDADGGPAAAPLRDILRCEVARSVYRLLNAAEAK